MLGHAAAQLTQTVSSCHLKARCPLLSFAEAARSYNAVMARLKIMECGTCAQAHCVLFAQDVGLAMAGVYSL